MKRRLNILCLVVMLVLSYSVLEQGYYIFLGAKMGAQTGLELGKKGSDIAAYKELMNLKVVNLIPSSMESFDFFRDSVYNEKSSTARSAINDVVEGFELGANDYLKKPFGMQELIIRIKALVGKAFSFTEEKPKETTVFEIGDYRFNSVTQRLAFAGSTPTSPNADTEVELSHRESEILKRLCENRNQVVNTQNVLLDLWGDDSFFNSRSLHVFITKLRHKLAGDERIRIVNVRGIGYKLIVN